MVLLLPGSRPDELRRHLPVMIGALALIRAEVPNLRVRIVLPNESFVQQARARSLPLDWEIQGNGLPESLAEAHVAIAKTGTVTTECAYFGVPTVTFYKTSWSNWQAHRKSEIRGHAQLAGQ